MEILVIFGIVIVPLCLIAVFAIVKERKEERKEQLHTA